MENEEIETSRKRMKSAMEENEGEIGGGDVGEVVEGDVETAFVGSEEMAYRINAIHERIEQFTQQVVELLDKGKMLFKNLSADFEERLITIHKEQIEKWQDEINELRLLDSSNEEANALLQNARLLLHSVNADS
ncbi:knotted 1-binding protein [Thalictrum thalictroides]|uniref:Knotted 1-binding protein n=1 Tax=Thalictrum thalictroides TaxID=46969 RepID=A0A7J6WDK3_THATH|nr:knotted 1-binding protein [Thalictrum thalictroides]